MVRSVSVFFLGACASALASPEGIHFETGFADPKQEMHDLAKEEIHDLDAAGDEIHQEGDDFEDEDYDFEAEREKHLMEQFAEIDLDNDGYITKDEAIAMITATEDRTREQELASIDQFIKQADVDKDGKVTEDEYIIFANRVDAEHYERNYQKIQSEFDEADADGDGFVTEEEVRALVGSDVNEEDIKAFMTDADDNDDGVIDLSEYHLYAQSQEEMYGENYENHFDEQIHDHHDSDANGGTDDPGVTVNDTNGTDGAPPPEL